MKGIFITLEGPDGSGKSTITRLLSEYLKEKGQDVVTTREPGGTKISEDIRTIILDSKNTSMSNVTEALLYAASRAQHVSQKIAPAIEEGKIIICDRFVLSSLVYQGIGRGLGVDKIKAINDFAIQGVEPDLILFFDISPEIALKRKTRRNQGDRLEREKLDFHQKVYEGYLSLIEIYEGKIKVIDATKTKENTFEQVRAIVDNLLEKKKEE
ncbi:dTMP kinase [Proteiniborus ethanoligenes]|uniref:Thymidylate kinase n=1 Tax=Proteiniborus ethanoligenes TaxID=415015 RepID=A0A1H3PDC1_9FIRM|nr:dTMP kinase [Proteiniborus ethanoligenes]SDY99142.1 dTMP kinase [Proteiniborus ethanoligenes]